MFKFNMKKILYVLIFIINLFPSPLTAEENRLPDDLPDNMAIKSLSPNIKKIPGGQALLKAVSPEKYILGPGDSLIIQIWGGVDLYHKVTVTAEGKIVIPTLGTLDVRNKTLKEVQEEVARTVARLHRNVQSSTTLSGIRMFEVFVLGEVKKPGIYYATPITHLSELIDEAEGVLESGSIRDIEIRKENALLRKADMFAFLRSGELDQNPLVPDGSTIFVPVNKGTAIIKGEIKRPDKYILREGETLSALMETAGGLTPEAAKDKITLTRIRPDQKKELIKLDLADPLNASIEIEDGDLIEVPSVKIAQNLVKVRTTEGSGGAKEGETSRIFEMREGETIKDLMLKIGEINPWSDLKKAYIIRSSDNPGDKIIPVDLNKLMVEKDEASNLPLKNGDILTIPAIENNVYMTGWVRNPGPIPFRPNRFVNDYIGIAGGPGERGKTSTVMVFRDNKLVAKGENIPVQPGDTIFVPEKSVKWWQDYLTILTGLTSVLIYIVALGN